MREHADWSYGLGRYKGVHLRVHLFFLLFGAVTLLIAWQQEQGHPPSDLNWLACLSVLMLFISVFLHAVAHATVLHRLGGMGERLVLTPWGELGSIRLPLDPRGEVAAVMAGPLMNLALCLVLLPILWVGSDTGILGLLHPLAPVDLVSGPFWVAALKLAFWINWLLVLINLVPAFPFDGGRALVAMISIMRPSMTRRQVVATVSRITRISAFVLLVIALFIWNRESASIVPTWFALLLLAIFLFFSAHQEESLQEEEEADDLLFGYDFSQGYTSLERTIESPQESDTFLRQWLSSRRQQRQDQKEVSEQDEDRRIDEILSRLHDQGAESLSPEDRRLLKRVSARYRSRDSAGPS